VRIELVDKSDRTVTHITLLSDLSDYVALAIVALVVFERIYLLYHATEVTESSAEPLSIRDTCGHDRKLFEQEVHRKFRTDFRFQPRVLRRKSIEG